MSNPRSPTPETPLTAEMAEAALRGVVRELRAAGHLLGCRMLSRGDECDCALCLIDLIADRNQPETINLRREVARLREALAHAQQEAEAAKDIIRRDSEFQEWAQGYLNSARWAGHDRSDAIRVELTERDSALLAVREQVAAIKREAEVNECSDPEQCISNTRVFAGWRCVRCSVLEILAQLPAAPVSADTREEQT